MKKSMLILILIVLAGITMKAQTAYIPNAGDGTVSVINLATNIVDTTFSVGQSEFGVSVSADGASVYIGNMGAIGYISTQTNSEYAYSTCLGPNGIVASPDGSKVYVANIGYSNMQIINTSTNISSSPITLSNTPFGVAINPDGTKVYFTIDGPLGNDSLVNVFNTTTNTVTTSIFVGHMPTGIAISPNGMKAYVANANDNTVSVINSIMDTVIATIQVGHYPYGIVVNHDGSKVYVSNYNDNTISVIDSASNTVINTIPVGLFPVGLSISPDGSKLVCANSQSNTINIINPFLDIVTDTIAVGHGPLSFGNFISSAHVGIPSINNDKGISIYPNPTANTITIHQDTYSPNQQIIITDVLGNRVYSQALNTATETIDISHLSSGIYFYEVSGKRGKIIKE